MGVRLFAPRVDSSGNVGGRSLPVGRRRDAAALSFIALALYLSLALLSLRVDSVGRLSDSGNWVGPVGAWLARALVSSFGFTAWLLPIEVALLVRPLLRRSTERHIWGVRVASHLLMAVVIASLTHVAFPHLLYGPGLRAGGSVGLFLGEVSDSLFSTVGSFLVGGTIIGLILIARSGFSFVQCCDKSFALLRWARLGASEAVARALVKLRSQFLQRRQQLRERAEEFQGVTRGLLKAAQEPEPEAEQEPEAELVKPKRKRTSRRSSAPAAARGASGDAELPEVDAPEQVESPYEAELEIEQPPVDKLPSPIAAQGAVERKPPGIPRPDSVPSVVSAAEPAAVRLGPAELGPTIVDTSSHSQVLLAEEPSDKEIEGSAYVLPATDLLEPTPKSSEPIDRDRVLRLSEQLEQTLADYGVTGTVEEILPGPTVTTYEVAPKAGTKVGKVAKLAGDLALGLSVDSVRIIAPIPGKGRVGFELPNHKRIPVNLRELVEDQRFEKLSDKAPLPVVMGRDIVGTPFYADLSEMPHMIVAGATGAGKSVGLNVMLCSLLFRRTPDELRLLMVDPKVVELAPFEGIPHMLLPVVTDMKQASTALKWAVNEMERRYRAFAVAGTKNIGTFNRWVDRVATGQIPPPDSADMESLSGLTASASLDGRNLPTRLPYIVIVVDEFADLMMQQGKEVEVSVARLAQKARAAGMHVILATQRPSVDVITGMIKANFPTRVAFRVSQKVDSRTILDDQGAEYLLGRGDMLAKLNGSSVVKRVQCPFISEEEVSAITDHLRLQGTPEYQDDILKAEEEDGQDASSSDEPLDPLFDNAVQVVGETQRCSTSWVQRKLGIGYNRAAKIVEMMEVQGMVGPPNGSKEREIFIQGH